MRVHGRALTIWTVCVLGAAVCVLQDPIANKDREAYVSFIEAAAEDGQALTEPGFVVLVHLLAAVVREEWLATIFFIVVALVSLRIKLHLFDRYGGSVAACLLVFFSYFFLLHEMTQIRVGLAIGMLYGSWFAYARNDTRSYWGLGILASFFHLSCMLFLVAPLLLSRRLNGRWIIGMTVVVCIAGVSLVSPAALLSAVTALGAVAGIEKVGIYLDFLSEGVLTTISPLRLIPHLSLLGFALITHRRWKCDQPLSFLVQIYAYGVLLFCALWSIPVLAYRISDLFLFSSIFICGRLRKYFAAAHFYPILVGYTGLFLLYTLLYSGLFDIPE